MKFRFFRRKQDLADMAEFESLLDAVLVPRMPRTEFVDDLGQRLIKRDLKVSPHDQEEQNRKRILMVGGIIGSALMILTSVRGLMALIGVIKLLIQRCQRDSLARRSASAV